MSCDDKIDTLRDLVQEIKLEVTEIRADLKYHIKRTDLLEADVKESRQHRDSTVELVLKQGEKSQQNIIKTVKVSLGVFAALAALVSALAAWVSHESSVSAPAVVTPTPTVEVTP